LVLRITGLYALTAFGGSGYEKPQSALRAFMRFFSATFLQPWTLLRKALIRAAKPSHTAGTLGAIRFLIWCKKILKNVDKYKKMC
jgi:hypothetical protein